MNYIGIDVHKSICTAVVMNDDEKVIDQIIDFGTNDEGYSFIVDHYSPEDSYILFENLTTAHRVYHFFKDKGYRVEGLHTGHGCVTEISKTDFKTDLEDATKLARMCKDHFTGRREYSMAHFADIDSMKAKELCRVMNDCSEQRDKLNLRIQAYMDMFDIHLPGRLKKVYSNRAIEYLESLNHPALTIMIKEITSLMELIKEAKKGLESLFSDNEDVKNLMSIKGIAIQTAATIYTAVDGIERFETPESLVSYFGLKITRHESGGDRDMHGHINKKGDPLVRKYLSIIVVSHPKHYPDSDLAKFYKRKKEEMPHWKAVTAAMRKLVCIIWAMLSKHQTYRFSSPVKA